MKKALSREIRKKTPLSPVLSKIPLVCGKKNLSHQKYSIDFYGGGKKNIQKAW